MTPKVAVLQGLRPAPFGTLASFFYERSRAAGGGAKVKLDLDDVMLRVFASPLRFSLRIVGAGSARRTHSGS